MIYRLQTLKKCFNSRLTTFLDHRTNQGISGGSLVSLEREILFLADISQFNAVRLQPGLGERVFLGGSEEFSLIVEVKEQ